MPDPAITTVHFAPGGHLLRVEAGPVPVDAQSRTAKDVFAPGPGWTLMAGEGAGSSSWEGITRTAERATVIATVRLEPDGRRTATLAPVAEEALADRRLQAVERWLRSLGEEVRAQTAVLLAAARAALDDDRNTTAAEDAAALVQMNEAAQRISQHMDAPSLLRLGGPAADLLGELSACGTAALPFQRPMAALVATDSGLDLTAVTGAMAELGLSVSMVPEGKSVVAHLETTRMHCAAVVLGRHEQVPAPGFDRWLERFLGPMLRIEIARLRSAGFRTTPAGRLQLDADLTPNDVLAAIRTHAADRGLDFG